MRYCVFWMIPISAIFSAVAAWAGPPESWSSLTIHCQPRRSHPDARTENWPRFLGPRDNATSRETHLDLAWPDTGPVLVWEVAKGKGYASPAVVDGRVYLFHRVGKVETLDCLDAQTGRRFWSFGYPVEYKDRYGFSDGPRAGPVVDGDRVYLFGVTAVMHCLDKNTGEVLWKKHLRELYEVPQGFFGSGPCPLVWKNLLVHNVGGKKEPGGVCVAAFDKLTGEEKWTLPYVWGASYASPVVGRFHERDCLLVFAGGESRPAHGGLLLIDPLSGQLHDAFPWRADKYESVNASSPTVVPGNRVFLSETYAKGGVMLAVDEKFKFAPVWKTPHFGMHWMNPVLHDGHLFGYAGRNEPDAYLGCFAINTGEEKWRDASAWKINIKDKRGRDRSFSWSFFRGSLLQLEGGRALALGELGTLGIVELGPIGFRLSQKIDLFHARQTWSLPAISRGLLFVCQHDRDMISNVPPRLLCYDLRAGKSDDGGLEKGR